MDWKKIKVLSKTLLYKGYHSLEKYELEIPSLNPEKNSLFLNHREVLKTTDSILVLLYSPQMDVMIFCKEFRVGVFFNHAQDDPFILQGVAGTIEANDTPELTAKKEVKEETGLSVEHLKLIASVYKSPGLMTEKTFIYYGEINTKPTSGLYGSDEGEEIHTHIIPRSKTYQLMDEGKFIDAATLIALNWFRRNESDFLVETKK